MRKWILGALLIVMCVPALLSAEGDRYYDNFRCTSYVASANVLYTPPKVVWRYIIVLNCPTTTGAVTSTVTLYKSATDTSIVTLYGNSLGDAKPTMEFYGPKVTKFRIAVGATAGTVVQIFAWY